MISYLKGNILKKTDKGIVLDIGNLGYFVHLSRTLLEETHEKEELELFIHSHIREDAFDLYGFINWAELTFFEQLLSVNGVGPKVAMEIITLPVEDVKKAIINKDIAFITRIKGIGKKTAERVVLELKGKIDVTDISGLDRKYKHIENDINDDITEALMKFGYSKQQVKKALRDLPPDIKDTEEIITYFLKHSR
jgi:Holliday junction DNA helicase RuvA